MAPDRTILHLVKKNIPVLLPLSRIMACTLLSLSYAPAICRTMRDLKTTNMAEGAIIT